MPGNQEASHVMAVQVPATRSFGEVVHFLDQAYTAETLSWSKHAKICLKSHQLTMVALLLDTDDPSDNNYPAIVDVFAEGVKKVIKIHELEVVPVVYPVHKRRGFGDENERLESALGIDLNQITLP